MEPKLYLTLLLLLFVTCITIFLFAIFYKHKSQYDQPNLPPGQPGLPFIGETLEFLSTGWNGHPETFVLDRVERFRSTVFKTHLVGHRAAVLSGSSGNKFLFSNEDKLVRAWWPDSIDKIFPVSEGTSVAEESLRMRKLLPQFMKPEALQRYVGIMDDVASRHFELGWENRRVVKVFPLAKNFTFWVACRLFLSMDDHEQIARFVVPFEEVAAGIFSLPLDLPGTAFRRAIRSSKLIREEYLMGIIKKRKAELVGEDKGSIGNGDTWDILSSMLTATDESGKYMSETSIAHKILALLIAGHDTASATCTFVVKFLAELPHIYDRVYQEQAEIAKSKAEGERLNWEDVQKMKYSWHVACEVLRLAPPLQGTFREATKDFTFNGVSIPKGWKVPYGGSFSFFLSY